MSQDPVDAELKQLLADLTRLPGFEGAAVAPAPPPAAEPPAEPAAPADAAAPPDDDAVVVRVPANFRPEAEIVPVAHKRILVVDDNDDYRETLRALLLSRGYEVLAAGDGASGMELTLGQKPDLVITDFNMPRMNGYELVSRLRADHDRGGTPMILFTGAANRRQLQGLHIERCLFLEKPFRNEVLFDAVADFIGLGLPPGRQSAPPPPPTEGEIVLERSAVGVPAPDADELPPLLKPAALPPAPKLAASAPLRAAPPQPQAPEPPVSTTLDEVELGDDASLQVDQAREEPVESNALDGASDSPTIMKVNRVLVHAVRLGASDVHFECEADRVVVRFRIDGAMRHVATLPFAMRGRVAARIKVMSKLVITEKRIPQDGQIRAVVAGKDVDFRVSTVPGQYGENVVLRLATGQTARGRLQDVGFGERDLHAVERSLSVANGLVLVTGPTGSGKTTTLYTMLQELNTPENKILTVEDPVEQELPGITQVAVKPIIGLTFEKVLRAFMRQDPDIILLGEIRDLETADIAIKASITGHLVLSTLHTNSAPATVVRLTQMGVPPYLIASSLRLIVAQRLVRLLCPKCRQLSDTPELDLKLLTEAEVRRVKKSWVGKGCEECHNTGYRGRMPLFEAMPVSTMNMRQAILEEAGEDRLLKLATLEGMTTLREAALEVVAAGRTSLSEAMPFIVGE